MTRKSIRGYSTRDDNKCLWVEGNLITNERDESKAYIGYLFDVRNGVIEDFDFVEVIPSTLCQYTGLTDKNGRKIWENDIVSNKWCFARGNSIVRYGEYKDWHMTEKFKCGNLGFFLEPIDVRESAYTRKDMMYFAGNCKVIGNIFDIPMLLKED